MDMREFETSLMEGTLFNTAAATADATTMRSSNVQGPPREDLRHPPPRNNNSIGGQQHQHQHQQQRYTPGPHGPPSLAQQATSATNIGSGSASSAAAATPASMTNLYLPVHAHNPIPKHHFMRSGDIKFVVSRVLFPLETFDLYFDDYYYLQYVIQKTKQAQIYAVQHQQAPPPDLYAFIPAPLWKDSKERVLKEMNEQKLKLLIKNNSIIEEGDDTTTTGNDMNTKKEEEKSLGSIVRSDVFRPREIISMSGLKNDDEDDYGESFTTSAKVPFQSKLWSVRAAVQRGYEALFTVQELQHILSAQPESSLHTALYVEILSEMEKAVKLLCHAIGINTVAKNPLSVTPGSSHVEVMLDGALLTALVQTAKGKKLLARSIGYLNPDQRWAIIPAIFSKLLQIDPESQSPEDCQVEIKLLRLITEFMLYAHQYQKEQHVLALQSGQLFSPFSVDLLDHLRKCLKAIMISLMQKMQLKRALKSRRERAEAMNIIVEVGIAISTQVDSKSYDDWQAVKEAFLTMLET